MVCWLIQATRKLNCCRLFGGEVKKAGEALLAGEGVDAGESAVGQSPSSRPP